MRAGRNVLCVTELRRRFGTPLTTHAGFLGNANEWRFSFDPPVLIDHVVVQATLVGGESVRRFRVQVRPTHGRDWITVWHGFNVGDKAIWPFPPIRARGLRLVVDETDGPVALRSITVHRVGS